MSIATQSQPSRRTRIESQLTTWLVLDAEKIAYVALFVLAVATRFWDLGVRVMSHDESLHTRFSWDLYRGNGFRHTPLMHGPLLFHMTALSYFLFGDNDFTSRIYPAALGVLLVMFPLLMRRWLGKLGALATSAMFLISPLILYYSRYIRHDIPAIFFAMVVAYASWRYVEKPDFKLLAWLAAAMALLFASKEVAFIYIAIFGSFLTIYLVVRHLLDASYWENRALHIAFVAAVVGVLLALAGMALLLYRQHGFTLLEGLETAQPVDPLATGVETPEAAAGAGLLGSPVAIAAVIESGLMLAAGLLALFDNKIRASLKHIPVFDVLMVMGTLVLPLLTPFAIKAAGFDPMDPSVEGIRISWAFTGPMMLVSIVLGLIWGVRPGETDAPPEDDWEAWARHALLNNRWLVIGGIYYAIYIFFFTTMFTNGDGLGTGIVGSLGYWLEQQGVRRGSQPGYYYVLVMVPIYEFLPLILTLVAGVVGIVKLLFSEPEATPEAETGDSPEAERETHFPVVLFAGYWTVLNFAAYSLAGEKMPWLTTHLTTPMILIGGWLVGQLLEGIEWRALWERRGWLVLALLPLLGIALGRVLSPLFYAQRLFGSQTQEDLANTGLWLTALIVLVAGLAALLRAASRLGAGQTLRLAGLLAVGALTFQTARAAWGAAFINYDDATEYLVYAHSAPSVKLVMDQIREISLRTTDSLDLKVAYDNRVSWPFSWYLRDYPKAIYFADQPTRGQLSDAPVILAGPDNWAKVEPLIGDRYYSFEYIRMWWPMQDYFDLTTQRIRDDLTNPDIRRGLWAIFFQRNYALYGEATGKDFSLSNWPVAERMRFYVRKDVFAQVWDYGVAATELAEASDPYAENRLTVQPIGIIGGPGDGPEELDGPRGMAVGPDGLLYVADSNNHRIQVFTTDGEHVRTIGAGGPSEEPGGFNEPWGVAVDDDGYLYVADTWNHRIQKFDADGEFVTAWGVFGQQEDPFAFWGPRDVAIGPQGNVFVTDTGNKRVSVYTPDGEFVRRMGSPGGLDGELDEPSGIVVSEDGEVYVVDTWNQRVQAFSPAGPFLSQWPVSAWYGQSLENKPYIALDDANETVYLTDPEGFRVLAFSVTGQYLASFGDFQTFNLASGIALDAEGDLYVSDGIAGTILRFAPVLPADQ